MQRRIGKGMVGLGTGLLSGREKQGKTECLIKELEICKKVSSLQKSEKYLPGRITWSNVPTGFSEETAGLMISVMVDWIMLYQQERI